MKTIKFTGLIIGLLIMSLLQAQTSGINSINILPASPADTSNIKVEAVTTHPSSPCQLQSSSISVSGDSIFVTAIHKAGMMPAMCNSTDTITIGTLSAKSYTLKYSLEYSSLGVADSAYLNFTVQAGSPGVFRIDSLKVLPPEPFSDDSIQALGFISLPGNNCHMTDSTVNISGSSIESNVFHSYDSASSVMCHVVDTLQLGKLNKGFYNLKYRLWDSAGTIILDSITRSLEVDGPLKNAFLDSLKVEPGVPFANQDSIKVLQDSFQVISYSSFPFSNCFLTDSAITISNDSIKINAFFHAENYSTPCHSTDTFEITQLGAGQYKLIYFLRDSITSDTLDAMTKHIRVIIESIPENKAGYGEPEIYPNPAIDNIDLDLSSLPQSEFTIRIYSTYGQILQQLSTTQENITLNIKELNQGVYLLVIENERGIQWVEKITKTSN